MKTTEFLGKLKKQKKIEPNADMNNMFVRYAMEEYAEAKCKEQREICADIIWKDEVPGIRTKGDNADKILTVPTPDFK